MNDTQRIEALEQKTSQMEGWARRQNGLGPSDRVGDLIRLVGGSTRAMVYQTEGTLPAGETDPVDFEGIPMAGHTIGIIPVLRAVCRHDGGDYDGVLGPVSTDMLSRPGDSADPHAANYLDHPVNISAKFAMSVGEGKYLQNKAIPMSIFGRAGVWTPREPFVVDANQTLELQVTPLVAPSVDTIVTFTLEFILCKGGRLPQRG